MTVARPTARRGRQPQGTSTMRPALSVFSAFTSSRKIPLSVSFSVAHAAAVVELAVQRMHMGIKHKRAPMSLHCSCGYMWGGLIGCGALRRTSTPKERVQRGRCQRAVAEESATSQQLKLSCGLKPA